MSGAKAKNEKSKKRSLPTTFLDCRSLLQVPSFPSDGKEGEVISSDATSEVGKQVFLERLVKEVVKPFRPTRRTGQSFTMVDGKLQKEKNPSQNPDNTMLAQSFWKQRVRIGTNQCMRLLMEGKEKSRLAPALLVMAKDVYPPTMLAHVPAISNRLKIPLLILPGKASSEFGKALGFRKAAIMLFTKSDEADADNEAMNSFIEFVISEIPEVNKPAS